MAALAPRQRRRSGRCCAAASRQDPGPADFRSARSAVLPSESALVPAPPVLLAWPVLPASPSMDRVWDWLGPRTPGRRRKCLPPVSSPRSPGRSPGPRRRLAVPHARRRSRRSCTRRCARSTYRSQSRAHRRATPSRSAQSRLGSSTRRARCPEAPIADRSGIASPVYRRAPPPRTSHASTPSRHDPTSSPPPHGARVYDALHAPSTTARSMCVAALNSSVGLYATATDSGARAWQLPEHGEVDPMPYRAAPSLRAGRRSHGQRRCALLLDRDLAAWATA